MLPVPLSRPLLAALALCVATGVTIAVMRGFAHQAGWPDFLWLSVLASAVVHVGASQ